MGCSAAPTTRLLLTESSDRKRFGEERLMTDDIQGRPTVTGSDRKAGRQDRGGCRQAGSCGTVRSCLHVDKKNTTV